MEGTVAKDTEGLCSDTIYFHKNEEYSMTNTQSLVTRMRWRLTILNRHCRFLKYYLGLLLIVPLYWIITRYIYPCGLLFFIDILGYQRPKIFCSSYHGRLANQMFIYAFSYRWAKERNLQNIIEKNNILTEYFNISPNTLEEHGFNAHTCRCFWTYEDSIDCGYDAGMEDLPNTDISVYGYFQSWKYWIKYEKELRKAFKFKSHISSSASEHLRRILKERDVAIGDGTVLIGIHVRHGDYSKTYFRNFGYRLATPSYLEKAIAYFKRIYSKILFIVCSNGMEWTMSNIPGGKDTYFVRGSSPIEDMALLTLTNHTIITVGTFGWMIGWLTGGTVIYYKHPFVIGSKFSKQFHSNYSDYFYPGWIGMD